VALCIQCGTRPYPKDKSRLLCRPCLELREQTERETKARQPSRGYARFWKLLYYKHTVLGVTLGDEKEDGTRQVTIKYVGEVESVAKLPKGESEDGRGPKTIDLDHYCEGFTRSQIRSMKRKFNIIGGWQFRKIKRTRVDN